jgi:hypothetical protein
VRKRASVDEAAAGRGEGGGKKSRRMECGRGALDDGGWSSTLGERAAGGEKARPYEEEREGTWRGRWDRMKARRVLGVGEETGKE